MLNLDKINTSFDLNNISPSLIGRVLVEHRKTINLVMLIGSLVIAAAMFMDYRSKQQAWHARMSREQIKLSVIKSNQDAVQNLDKFLSGAPKELDEFELATLISRDADLYHVRIPSFNPAVQAKDMMGMYDVREFEFSASADNFKDAMLFLRKIEKSYPPLRVNSWSGREGQDGTVSFDIDISVVHIHS